MQHTLSDVKLKVYNDEYGTSASSLTRLIILSNIYWSLSAGDRTLSFNSTNETILSIGRTSTRLSDCNGTRTQNHLARKRTLNYLAKLAKLTRLLIFYFDLLPGYTVVRFKNASFFHCEPWSLLTVFIRSDFKFPWELVCSNREVSWNHCLFLTSLKT